MDLKLQGRVVAITGGASGIGRSCALRYLEEGCRVAVCGRNRAKLEVFRRHCREAGHEVLCVEADVADTEALEEVRGHGGVSFRTAGRMVQQRRNGHLQAAHGRQP